MKLRSFLAIDLPEGLRLQLGAVQQQLPMGRLVRGENLHLTLVFLGDVEVELLQELDEALSGVTIDPFELTLRGLGVFGGAKPRSVYAAVAECPSLKDLQARLERVARQVGIQVERRRFMPHVTLARMRPGQVDDQLLARRLSEMPFEAPAFVVDAFGLYRSTLHPEGPVYEEMARYPLADGVPGP